MNITVFTPAYNRAHLLGALYASLKQQTYTDFEWLIVDDGSTDDTGALVTAWQAEDHVFPIQYHKQENGGKCSAINTGLMLAHGRLFLTVDSDDTLTPDALEKIASWEEVLPQDEKFCGVSGNGGHTVSQTVNNRFEGEYHEGTLLDRYTVVDGERLLAIYTDVHRQYLYPLFEGERFMTEAVVWNRMARDGYKMRFYNDIIWLWEYQEGGLTKSGIKLFLENPRGYGLWLREKQAFIDPSRKAKLRMYYSFMCDLKERYDTKLIASCIGAPTWLIGLMKTAHTILHIGR